ncbi:MAG: ATP-binding protein [Sterolibacteriaceae bacterium MAG5]|nr:ATP-binding protein [Candidatus Nitricoxidireducens bremensis]
MQPTTGPGDGFRHGDAAVAGRPLGDALSWRRIHFYIMACHADGSGVAVRRFLQRKLTRPVLVVMATALVANLFVGALVALSLYASYQQYRERAAVTSRNTNRLVAQGVASEIDRVDLGLQAVSDEYLRLHAAGRLDGSALTRFLVRQQARLPMVDSLWIADAHGRVLHGSDQEPPSVVSLADRDYFAALRDNSAAGLVISRPVLGKISGKWVLIFGRRLTGADGRFLGIAIAPVTIAWFEKMFARLEVGPKGAVVLRGDASRDFDLLGRFPSAGYVGQTKVSAQFRAMITARPQEGTYEAYAGADNIRRTFSYQAVGAYPLITLVGLSTDDTLSPWWHEVRQLAALAIVFAVLSALGGWALVRAWNNRAAAYESIRGLNEELAKDNIARRNAENEVVRLNTVLEQRVRERTAELETANKDLESFSYSASHDLRAPLRAIAGYSQILLEDERRNLSATGQEMLDRVIHNSTRMGKLIDDILAYSRAGRRSLDCHAIDMTALARDIAAELAADYPAARVRIDDMPDSMGDRTMLEQIFQNLIGNALKYSAKQDQPEVTVGVERDGDRNVYFVRDNGAGFDMQYAGGLFGMFHRLHGEAEFPGTGVGLAIVKRLIERHGGRIWAQAEPGNGATFYFTLGAEKL